MSYESSAEPIKLGYLCDFPLPEGYPEHRRLVARTLNPDGDSSSFVRRFDFD